uniref:KRAB domain-containing protein n=1 Tax=Catagonus wagneri TaxID=51154 RepID=A0A8C3VVL7_9CETA
TAPPRGPGEAWLGQERPGALKLADAAMYFFQEEWRCRRPAQRALDRDVMQETYSHLSALRFAGPKPTTLISWMKGRKDVWGMEAEDPEKGLGTQDLGRRSTHAASFRPQ